MFTEGNVLFCENFHFKNDSPPKPKYLIVLKLFDKGNAILASLPTSLDSVPENHITKRHGCLNKDSINFNCYYFEGGRTVTENNWSFPKNTFIYGKNIDFYEQAIIGDRDLYRFELKGKLMTEEKNALVSCILKSKAVKRKVKRILEA